MIPFCVFLSSDACDAMKIAAAATETGLRLNDNSTSIGGIINSTGYPHSFCVLTIVMVSSNFQEPQIHEGPYESTMPCMWRRRRNFGSLLRERGRYTLEKTANMLLRAASGE